MHRKATNTKKQDEEINLVTIQEKLDICVTILNGIYVQPVQSELKRCIKIISNLKQEWDQEQATIALVILTKVDKELQEPDKITDERTEAANDIRLIRKTIKEEADAKKPDPEYTDKPLNPLKPKKQRKAKHG